MSNYITIQALLMIILALLLISNYLDNTSNDKPKRLMSKIIIFELIKTICTIISLIIEGNAKLEVLNIIVTAGIFILGTPQIIFLGKYIEEIAYNKRKRIKKLMVVFMIYGSMMILLAIISMFTPILFSCKNGIYDQGMFYFEYHILYIISFVFLAIIIIYYRKSFTYKQIIEYFLYIIPPCICIMIQPFVNKQFDIVNVGICIGLIIIYITIHIERKNVFIQQQNELAQNKIALTLSQLQPHFIFNSISSIMALPCMNDEAKSILKDFAVYLRGNINSISSNEKILFEKELEHIKVYTRLEKLRFGEKINIEYDLKEKNFFIPPLLIQVLVENAIKHGISKMPNGGIVRLTTDKSNERIIIIVEDDGVGFEYEALTTKDHFGLSNVKHRLELINGTMNIESKIGKGTKITVEIPRSNQ